MRIVFQNWATTLLAFETFISWIERISHPKFSILYYRRANELSGKLEHFPIPRDLYRKGAKGLAGNPVNGTQRIVDENLRYCCTVSDCYKFFNLKINKVKRLFAQLFLKKV